MHLEVAKVAEAAVAYAIARILDNRTGVLDNVVDQIAGSVLMWLNTLAWPNPLIFCH